MSQDHNDGHTQAEPSEPAKRVRTFLRGVVLYDDRRVTVDCIVRDFSDTGARLTFTALVSVPEEIELEIPQKQRIYQARVKRREQYEVGVAFEDARSGEPRRAEDADLFARVHRLESDVAALTRQIQKMSSKIFGPDGSDI